MPEESSTASSSGSVEEKPSSSAATADSSVDVMEEANKLIGTGNKHLVMGDVVSAVSVFQDACSMLATKYGDTAEECGEAFFLCGKSLLELARMEDSVLGNALEGVPDESEGDCQPDNPNIENANNPDDKTRDELRKQVYDAMAEEKKTGAGYTEETEDGESNTEETEDGEVNTEEMDDGEVNTEETEDGEVNTEETEGNGAHKSPVKPENGSEVPPLSPGKEENLVHEHKVYAIEKRTDAPVNGVQDSPGGCPEKESTAKEVHSNEQNNEKTEAEQDEEEPEGNADDDEDDDEEANGQEKEEEDVGNLQLAWEMLEVAKVIYKRKESKDDQLMAAQTYLKLGEVGAESGNYTQALEDFQECLALQLKHLPPHSRLLAETHYHVATTLCYMDQYNQAIQHYNSSIKVIKTRLEMLQEVIAAAEGAAGTEEERNELDELKQLLPDIREKVEDAKESQKTGIAASQAIQQTLGGTSTSSAFLCENGGASSSSAFATASQIPEKPSDDSSSSKAASDISHLVRKKRKPEEEESPVKDTDAKQAKQEAAVNGSSDSSASNENGVEEEKSPEATSRSSPVKSA